MSELANREDSLKGLRITAAASSLLGLLLAGFGIYFLISANQNAAWPVADGKVISAVVRTSSTGTNKAVNSRQYFGQVSYRYAVGDTVFQGNRYSMGDGNRATPMHNEREAAQADVSEKFPPQSPVKVHYDPADPGSAVLKTGASVGTMVPLIMGVVCLGFGAFCGRVGRRRASLPAVGH